MKNILYLILVILLAACSSIKKAVDVSTKKVDSISIETTTTVQAERLIDTTTTEKGHLIITEIEFSQSDSTNSTIASLSIRDGTLSIGGMKGKPIKSIKQTVFKEEKERKGKNKESHEEKKQNQSVALQKETLKQTRQVTPAPDPYKWRYIFYLSLVLFTGVLYFKRMPIVNWIKKMLCGFVKK